MSRRSTPERLYAAGRAATINRLIGTGELPDRAEAQVAAWEAQTAQDGRPRDGAYWDAAWREIGQPRSAQQEPR
jgi:hypothetical protein